MNYWPEKTSYFCMGSFTSFFLWFYSLVALPRSVLFIWFEVLLQLLWASYFSLAIHNNKMYHRSKNNLRWLIASRRMYVVTYYLSYFSVDWLSNLNVEAFKKAYYQVVHTHRNQYRILKAVVGLVWGIIFGERVLLILIWMSMWIITCDKPSIGFNWHLV